MAKTYINNATDFSKLNKETLVSMLEEVFTFINNERNTQHGVELASMLQDNALDGTDYGILDNNFEAVIKDNYYDKTRALLEARELVRMAMDDCDNSLPNADGYIVEDIKELLKKGGY